MSLTTIQCRRATVEYRDDSILDAILGILGIAHERTVDFCEADYRTASWCNNQRIEDLICIFPGDGIDDRVASRRLDENADRFCSDFACTYLAIKTLEPKTFYRAVGEIVIQPEDVPAGMRESVFLSTDELLATPEEAGEAWCELAAETISGMILFSGDIILSPDDDLCLGISEHRPIIGPVECSDGVCYDGDGNRI